MGERKCFNRLKKSSLNYFFGPTHAPFKKWGWSHTANRASKILLSTCSFKYIVSTAKVYHPYMKQKGKPRNYIFTVSLHSTSNKTTPLFGGTIWAEVRIWKNKWQLEDMSYSGAALQHVSDTCNVPQLTGMHHTGQHWRGTHFLSRHLVLCLKLLCTQLIRLPFFWNISSSIRVNSHFVPTVVFHILLLKPVSKWV